VPILLRTFLNAAPCQLETIEAGFDAVIVGASEATPHRIGEASHAADAPQAIRHSLHGAASDLARWDFDQEGPLLSPDFRLADVGDLRVDADHPEQNRDVIRKATQTILRSGAVPILLGGDDSVPIPFFEAFRDLGPMSIVQVDAHLDWRDECNGLRHTFSSPMRRASEMSWVKRIVQVGQRGIGGSRADDLETARRWGAKIITAAMVRREGIEAALAYVPHGARCVITIDCDGLDPSVIPAVLLPQPGGLGYGHVIDLIEGVSGKAQIVGVDIVELVPSRDANGIGALTAARLLCKALGCIAQQRSRSPLPSHHTHASEG
jgi:agmatinase